MPLHKVIHHLGHIREPFTAPLWSVSCTAFDPASLIREVHHDVVEQSSQAPTPSGG